MEEQKSFNRKKFTWIYCGVFLVIASMSMALMLRYAYSKVIIVSAEEAESQTETLEKEEKVSKTASYTLAIESSDESGRFVVHCPDGVAVSFYTRIDKKQATLVFKGAKADYFKRNAPTGDFTGIKKISEEILEGEVHVLIETEENVFVHADVQPKKVIVSLEPVDKENIVVAINPLYGGAHTGTIAGDVMEKDINLSIAKRVQELVKDKPYRVELVRDGDETMMTDERLKTLEILGADYYIGIGLTTNMEDTSAFGMSAVYNGELFRNGYENVDFAENVLINAAISTSNRACSLNPAGEENVILMAMDVPGTLLFAGTITNAEEAALLTKSAYIDKIAKGIIKALDSVVK